MKYVLIFFIKKKKQRNEKIFGLEEKCMRYINLSLGFREIYVLGNDEEWVSMVFVTFVLEKLLHFLIDIDSP